MNNTTTCVSPGWRVESVEMGQWQVLNSMGMVVSVCCLYHSHFLHRSQTWRRDVVMVSDKLAVGSSNVCVRCCSMYPTVRFYADIAAVSLFLLCLIDWLSLSPQPHCFGPTDIAVKLLLQTLTSVFNACELYLSWVRYDLLADSLPPANPMWLKRLVFGYALVVLTVIDFMYASVYCARYSFDFDWPYWQNLVIKVDSNTFIFRYCFFLIAILGLLLYKMLLARTSPPSIRIHLWRIGVRAFAHTLITSVTLVVAAQANSRTGERWFLIIVLLAIHVLLVWNTWDRIFIDRCCASLLEPEDEEDEEEEQGQESSVSRRIASMDIEAEVDPEHLIAMSMKQADKELARVYQPPKL